MADSDCIRTAPIAFYLELYEPHFVLFQDGQLKGTLNYTYKLEELNGRTPYCFTATVNDVGCGDENQADAILNPLDYHAILWNGVELYHFRATAQAESHCLLQTEFIVWIVDPPLSSSAFYAIISLTAISISLILFTVYFFYQRRFGRLHGGARGAG